MAEEKQFENRIKQHLRQQDAWFVKYWGGIAANGKKYTKDGVPDILACVKGRFLGIEVKASNGHPSDLQLYNLKKIDAAGGFAFLLYPKDFGYFKSFISCLMTSDPNMYIYYDKLKGRWSG